MHPDRGLVRKYRRSDGLSMIPDSPNTFTCQSNNTKKCSKGPRLLGPVTWNPDRYKYGASTVMVYEGHINKNTTICIPTEE